MVAGHLQEKNDFYYIVLSYKDAAGKRKTKWEATGLSVKRNKKKAEALLLERRCRTQYNMPGIFYIFY